MSFLTKLFSLFNMASDSTRPTMAGPANSPSDKATTSSVVTPAPRVMINWREGVDAEGGIAAHLLQPCAMSPNERPGGQSILEALRADNAAQAAARRPLILPLTFKQWTDADFAEAIGPHTYILLSGLTLQSSPREVRDWAGNIRAKNAKLAVDDGMLSFLPVLLEVADMIVVDVACQTLPVLERKLQVWRSGNPKALLLATGVASWAEHRLYQSLGFTYATGPFVTVSEQTEQENEIGESRVIVMEMLNALRGEADLSEVTAIAKRDPGVVVKLLERVNSPVFGLNRRVGSLDEVVMILGREVLYRWLAIALFTLEGDKSRDHTLLFLALSRANLLETLAHGDRHQAAELFLVGLLSLVDSLLGISREQIPRKMRLSDPVVDVLVRNDGQYVRHLALAQALERGEVHMAMALARDLGMSPGELTENYRQAMTLARAQVESA